MNTPFFFLHIPRTAGTTLNAIIKNNFAGDEVLSVYSKAEYEKCCAIYADSLDKIKIIQGHLFLQNYNPPTIYSKNVKVFTFLRDPIQRLVSEYFFLKTWKDNHLYAYLNDNDVTFSEYIASNEKNLKFRGKNFMTRMTGPSNRFQGPSRPLTP